MASWDRTAAGKTTLCRIAATVLLPTSGRVQVFGKDVVSDTAAVRRSIGIVFGGERGLYGRLTATQNLRFWCAMYGMKRREGRATAVTLLDRVGLGDRGDTPVETFSRGMKQRLHLARGLVADAPMLLLDEPTVGMDPVSARDFRILVDELRREGRTVLLTTHDMAEAQAVCDTVTFIDGGRIIGSGTPATVRRLATATRRIVVHDVPEPEAQQLIALLVEADLPTQTEIDDRSQTVNLTVPGEKVEPAMALILRAGHSSITSAPPDLTAVYLEMLGRRADGTERGMQVG